MTQNKMDVNFENLLRQTSKRDVDGLCLAHQSYGNSWCKRGGVGAFMMLARKWDRLENQTEKSGWDIFASIRGDQRPEGIIDDIRDLRRYLLLVETYMEHERIYSENSKTAIEIDQEDYSYPESKGYVNQD